MIALDTNPDDFLNLFFVILRESRSVFSRRHYNLDPGSGGAREAKSSRPNLQGHLIQVQVQLDGVAADRNCVGVRDG